MTGAPQDAAFHGPERKDVPGPGKVGRLCPGRRQRADRRRPVGGRHAGRRPVHVIDRDRERRLVKGRVAVHHEIEPEFLRTSGRERGTDDTAAVRREEIHDSGVHELRGANEVTFVLAVHVVHHDDRRAPADLTDGFLDIAEAFRTVGDL